MGRDKIKSSSLHSFHETHTAPTVVRIPFPSLVKEMLEQLGEDPTREGLMRTPDRVEKSLKFLTRAQPSGRVRRGAGGARDTSRT